MEKLPNDQNLPNDQIEIIKFNLYETVGYKEAKATQEKLVAENPFVLIIDTATYANAKKSRTALLTGRTSLEKQEKIINQNLTRIKKYVSEETLKLIEITKPSEDTQQTEVKRYEAEQARIKLEKEQAEAKRIKDISDIISTFKEDSILAIDNATYESIDNVSKEISEFEFDAEEFVGNLMQVKNSLSIEVARRRKFLIGEREISIGKAKMAKAKERAKLLLSFEFISNEDLGEIEDDKFSVILSQAENAHKVKLDQRAESEKILLESKTAEKEAVVSEVSVNAVTVNTVVDNSQFDNRQYDARITSSAFVHSAETHKEALNVNSNKVTNATIDRNKMIDAINSMTLPKLELTDSTNQNYYRNIQNALIQWKQTLIINIK